MSLDSIAPSHLKDLTAYLDEKGYGKPVLTSGGLDDEDNYLVLVAQQMCAGARRLYKPALKQPLHFFPLASADCNARVVWVNGCDVVMVCTGMFAELKRLARLEAAKAYNLAKANDIRSIFGDLFNHVEPGERTYMALQRLFLRGAMAFLVGHELGHLVAGHQGVFSVLAAFGADASASEGTIDEMACAAAANASRAPAQLAANALEIDADVQGCMLYGTTWHAASPEDEVERAVFRYMLGAPHRYGFMAAASIAAAFFLLGFNGFDEASILRKSHPLTSARLVVGLQCMAQYQGADFARQRATCKSAMNEGLLFVNGCFGSLLLDAHAARTGSEPPGIAAEFAGLPQIERHERLLRHTGVNGAMNAVMAINQQLAVLRAAFDSHENLWSPSFLQAAFLWL